MNFTKPDRILQVSNPPKDHSKRRVNNANVVLRPECKVHSRSNWLLERQLPISSKLAMCKIAGHLIGSQTANCRASLEEIKRVATPIVTQSLEPCSAKERFESVRFILLNSRSGEIRCKVKGAPLQMRTNAASETCPNANVGKVRKADHSYWSHESQVWDQATELNYVPIHKERDRF